jgi:hypothetical protein
MERLRRLHWTGSSPTGRPPTRRREIASIAANGYPTSGWHKVPSPMAGVAFGSGRYTLIVQQVDDGSWLIAGGQKFC